MKITITKSAPITEEIEVEFPIYLSWGDAVHLSHWTVECRIEETGRMVSITRWDEGGRRPAAKFELEVQHLDLARDLSHYLTARSHSRSTETDFNATLAAVLEAIA